MTIPAPASGPDLPRFTDEDLARIEKSVFAEIAEERAGIDARTAAHRRSRRRGWLTAGGIAAAFVVGVLVTPSALSLTGFGSSGSSVSSSGADPAWKATSVPSSDATTRSTADGAAPLSGAGTAAGGAANAEATRDIVRTGTATVQVRDVRRAVDALGDLAKKHGGYVESQQIGSTAPTPADGTTLAPPTAGGDGWVTLRVPAADLERTMDELSAQGTLLASSIGQNDVTATTTDLRAQVDALSTSVARLQQLMAQASSVADLLTAESTLTDRQSQLQSAQQQLKDLEAQVQMSSVQVSLVRETTATADPAGFGDGIAAGWHGLVVSLNALVIAIGFLLPWLAVAAVVALIVWALVRVRRARRRSTDGAEAESVDS
ncbi:DUF4349 domain-containing protein [uncultured Microbacterium sp.]|uniref:DUF4349 domain-containing protein n=1 Tax=uncultured Microbacterium sp. TaxID=191216 RepID=UPI0025F70FE5|nr:DUF4349 domain-containing protein [uncultured Microbacterium sp.]